MTNAQDVQLEPLSPLDLAACESISDIVAGMAKCSFGARMLGEVARTLTNWITEGQLPTVVCSEHPDSMVTKILNNMRKKGWLKEVLSLEQYSKAAPRGKCLVFVGHYTRAHAPFIESEPRESIFINEFGICPKGHVDDGHFPNSVFCDPIFTIPVLRDTLLERLEGIKTTANDLIEGIRLYHGLALNISDAARTLLNMIQDPDCTVFLTLSGAMTIAQLDLVIYEMIQRGWVQAISSTGALMAHGLMKGMGLSHYKHNPNHSDEFLAGHKLNRVTDTLEPEQNFTQAADLLDKALTGFAPGTVIAPSNLHQRIGGFLHTQFPQGRAILKSAYEKGVPVFVPAFVDSELGNDVYAFNRRLRHKGQLPIVVNPELDSEKLIDIMLNSKRAGIFSIGGGVPRNNVQNVAPLIEIVSDRLNLKLPTKVFDYGCRIAPDAMYTGHLSGCTYSENMSWRKMNPKGQFAEVQADATIVWPFLIKYVMEHTSKVPVPA